MLPQFARRITTIVITSGLLLTLIACGPRTIGYAVILWAPPDASYSNGSTVPVIAQSTLNRNYTLRAADGQPTIDAWRVAYFEDRDAAEEYAERFAPFADSFALSLRTALPIRERADNLSARVYRLRDGEIVKILGRSAEQVNVGGMVDYWYNVLTMEGVAGWVFGFHLEQSSAAGEPVAARSERDTVDRFLYDIASTTWRPEYFNAMLRAQQINLSTFSPRHGFWGDFEAKTFSLSLPGLQQTFAYTDYFMPSPNRLEFTGLSLNIELVSDNLLLVQYTRNNQQRTDRFVRFDGDVQEILDAETARRRALLEALLERGNLWVSTAYGSITVQPDGRFLWDGFDRLVPQVFPAGFAGQGRIEFGAFLDRQLAGRYDGALQFVLPNGVTRVFLYTLASDGLRLVFAPEDTVRDSVVTREPLPALVLFYRFVTS